MIKSITPVIGILLICTAIGYMSLSKTDENLTFERDFQGFTSAYSVSYDSEDEYQYRLTVFAENMKIAEENEKNNPLASFGVTPFSDRTPEEMKQKMGIRDFDNIPRPEEASNNNWIKEYYWRMSFDTHKSKSWASHMQPIQDQKDCGSCWAFATMAVLEGYRSIKGYGKQKLSEQQLVDCEPQTGGCNGGISAYAYHWLRENDACEAKHYPYIADDQDCKDHKCPTLGVHDEVHGTGMVISGEAGILHKVQNHGPVTVAVDASLWSTYKHGIVTGNCLKERLNHEVVVSGFGGHSQYPHYIIRNSWGSSWGEGGNIRILYGKNVCGIESSSFYPVM